MNDIDSLLEVVRLGTGATVLSRRAVTDGRGLALMPIEGPRMARIAAISGIARPTGPPRIAKSPRWSHESSAK